MRISETENEIELLHKFWRAGVKENQQLFILLKVHRFIIGEKGSTRGGKRVINEQKTNRNIGKIAYWDFFNDIEFININELGHANNIKLSDFCENNCQGKLEKAISELRRIIHHLQRGGSKDQNSMDSTRCFLIELNNLMATQSDRPDRKSTYDKPEHKLYETKRRSIPLNITKRELHEYTSGFCILCYRKCENKNYYCNKHNTKEKKRNAINHINKAFEALGYSLSHQRTNSIKPPSIEINKEKSSILFNWGVSHPAHRNFILQLRSIISEYENLEVAWQPLSLIINKMLSKLHEHPHLKNIERKPLIAPSSPDDEIQEKICKILELDSHQPLDITDILSIINRWSVFHLWRSVQRDKTGKLLKHSPAALFMCRDWI